MLEIKNERIAIPIVLFAGLLWSFGPLVVRYMDQANLNPWQYLFTRGVVIFIIGILILPILRLIRPFCLIRFGFLMHRMGLTSDADLWLRKEFLKGNIT